MAAMVNRKTACRSTLATASRNRRLIGYGKCLGTCLGEAPSCTCTPAANLFNRVNQVNGVNLLT